MVETRKCMRRVGWECSTIVTSAPRRPGALASVVPFHAKTRSILSLPRRRKLSPYEVCSPKSEFVPLVAANRDVPCRTTDLPPCPSGRPIGNLGLDAISANRDALNATRIHLDVQTASRVMSNATSRASRRLLHYKFNRPRKIRHPHTTVLTMKLSMPQEAQASPRTTARQYRGTRSG